jgi:hypothetical protein
MVLLPLEFLELRKFLLSVAAVAAVAIIQAVVVQVVIFTMHRHILLLVH